MSDAGLRDAVDRLRADGVGPDAVAVFIDHYRALEAGASGLVLEASIEPVTELPRLAELAVDEQTLSEAFSRTVVIKLNGGLGTSMGLSRAKSLLSAKDGLSFLDIIVGQVLALRAQHKVGLPLVFMNSFSTHADTEAALAEYPDLAVPGLPWHFLQNREPKLLADGLIPVDWPADPSLEWCPPGHGDLYPALRSAGVLSHLLAAGYRYAFVSNSDNLGAVADPRIVGWMASQQIPFLVESVRRIPADRKGGHLAIRRSDGRFVLRETAQTSTEDMAALQDLDRHRFCNSNNIWMDLERVAERLDAANGVLGLPLIRNVKTVDPADPRTPRVIQMESAMGAAVECFDEACSIEVPRERFVPVKTTNDLLVLRSDLYQLDATSRLVRVVDRTDPYVDLDPEFYKLIGQFEPRFPDGAPSLREAERFVVRGDVTFGPGVVVSGDVEIDQREPVTLAGTVLSGGGEQS